MSKSQTDEFQQIREKYNALKELLGEYRTNQSKYGDIHGAVMQLKLQLDIRETKEKYGELGEDISAKIQEFHDEGANKYGMIGTDHREGIGKLEAIVKNLEKLSKGQPTPLSFNESAVEAGKITAQRQDQAAEDYVDKVVMPKINKISGKIRRSGKSLKDYLEKHENDFRAEVIELITDMASDDISLISGDDRSKTVTETTTTTGMFGQKTKTEEITFDIKHREAIEEAAEEAMEHLNRLEKSDTIPKFKNTIDSIIYALSKGCEYFGFHENSKTLKARIIDKETLEILENIDQGVDNFVSAVVRNSKPNKPQMDKTDKSDIVAKRIDDKTVTKRVTGNSRTV